eukprot:TRINITY_DN124409_c0_g1_i1.p1 TRINITY_DN124409_c0_g1~~TRINITY_DN124409_c0_g1_i1.p1  ORF type:complete len:268 (+),score=57.94 TRINITY_DN124409_c0_g1_i1:168-971(+)
MADRQKAMLTGTHGYHPEFAGTFDSEDSAFQRIATSLDLARAESMELNNDPRFFSGNIIDKRLKAFHKLSIVSGLMLGTSMDNCFELKKNMDFTLVYPYIGYMQFFGFLCQMTVTFLCMISLYTIAHQLFYTYRLMTSGPTGFEAASMFYLNHTMTMWRHFSIKCLFNGLGLFIFSSGVQLFVKFYKDALNTHEHVNKPELDIDAHLMLAGFVCLCFTGCACFLCMLRRHHLDAFREHYAACQKKAKPITDTMRDMQHRGVGVRLTN